MELRRDDHPGGPVITGFAGQGFRVGERVYSGGLLIAPDGVADWEAPADLAALDPGLLGDLLRRESPPEFLLLGTGTRLVRPTRAFVDALEAMGIGVEAMDSRAAARAWAVLRREDRQIVGAFFPMADPSR
jgi:uncharacterized protein